MRSLDWKIPSATPGAPKRVPDTVPTTQVYARLNDDEKRKAELAIIEKLRRERDQSVQDAMEKVVREDNH